MPENPKEQPGDLAGKWDIEATLFTVACCYSNLDPDKWQKKNVAIISPSLNLLLADS